MEWVAGMAFQNHLGLEMLVHRCFFIEHSYRMDTGQRYRSMLLCVLR
ncbi:hypothetical protein ACFLXE_07630 [Chloroflexota bacterium]